MSDRLNEIKVTALPWDARKQMRAAVTIGDDVIVLTRDDQAMLRHCLNMVFDKGADEAGG